MGLFGSLLKATVGLVVETPVAIVADIATMGGVTTDHDGTYTGKALGKVMDNIKKSTEEE